MGPRPGALCLALIVKRHFPLNFVTLSLLLPVFQIYALYPVLSKREPHTSGFRLDILIAAEVALVIATRTVGTELRLLFSPQCRKSRA